MMFLRLKKLAYPKPRLVTSFHYLSNPEDLKALLDRLDFDIGYMINDISESKDLLDMEADRASEQ